MSDINYNLELNSSEIRLAEKALQEVLISFNEDLNKFCNEPIVYSSLRSTALIRRIQDCTNKIEMTTEDEESFDEIGKLVTGFRKELLEKKGKSFTNHTEVNDPRHIENTKALVIKTEIMLGSIASFLPAFRQSVSNILDVYKQDKKDKKLYAYIKNIENRLSLVDKDLRGSDFKKRTEIAEKDLTAAKSIRDSFDRKLIEIENMVSEIKEKADTAEDHIDKLAQGVSSTAIARDYRNRAEQEDTEANQLRKKSLTIMYIAAAILGTAIFDPIHIINELVNIYRGIYDHGTAKFALDPASAGIRAIFSLLLSVPAAYLARESAKHRVKHNAYEQIAMNIDAVHTLIKPLSDEDKNTILTSMANRLFSSPVGVDKGAANDAFPISTGELMMKMMDNLSSKAKESSTPKKPEDKEGSGTT